ncbi:12-oxophytodienoate reductase [Legionella israelensis]|nr:12-oxophytodienoate reductase [Legionella israelensis]
MSVIKHKLLGYGAMSLEILNTTFNIGELSLKNRIIMAPMSRNLSPNHIPTENNANYYQRRAQGGVGLIITEASAIDHPAAQGTRAHAGGATFAPGFTKEAAIGWQKVLNAVKEYGTPIFAQLWHVGSTREPALSLNPEIPSYGPSAIKHPRFDNKTNIIPLSMDTHDIEAHIEAYAQAAKLAMDLGFDGVELNAAHGYGIDQFFWSETNQRQDEYGGKTLLKRSRFAIDIIKAIKSATHQYFPISIRISQWKMGAYHYQMIKNLKALTDFILALSNAGVDVFHVSTRYFDEKFSNTEKTLATYIKEITHKPVIAVGSIATETDLIGSLRQNELGKFSLTRLKLASKMIAHNEVDLLAIGRPLIADSQWFNKVRANEFNSIIPFSKTMLEFLD